MDRLKQQVLRIAFVFLAGLSQLAAHATEPATIKTKTYCVGRFLVDIPKEALVAGQAYKFKFARIATERFSGGAEGLDKKMQAREAELKADKQKDGFRLVEAIQPSTDSRIFMLSRTYELFKEDLSSTGFEIYRVDGDRFFSMEATGFRNLLSLVDRLTEVISNLRARAADDIPVEPGFCIKDGFIADDGSKDHQEDAGISFGFPRWPELVITVSTSTVRQGNQETLFERVDKHPLPAVYKKAARELKTLRRGIHEAHGRRGQELLDLLPTSEKFKLQAFRWEAQGAFSKALMPDLVVELQSGYPSDYPPRRPSLSNTQAMKLFDSIVDSVRLRPTEPLAGQLQ